MTSRDFCYWLQGFFEITNGAEKKPPTCLDSHQVQMIESHLRLVFKHEIDPQAGGPKIQASLDKIHGQATTGRQDYIARC